MGICYSHPLSQIDESQTLKQNNKNIKTYYQSQHNNSLNSKLLLKAQYSYNINQAQKHLYELDDDYFIDQNSNNPYDKSQEVIDAFDKYPFKCIGRIVSCFYDLQIEKQVDLPFGTGSILSPRVVLTVAHNMYSKLLKQTANQVFFQPQIDRHKNGPLIKVTRFGIHQRYFDEKDPMSQNFDLAILILEENNIIKPEMCLNVRLDYKYEKQNNDNLQISGYPKHKNLHNDKFMQYFGQLNVMSCKDNLLTYKHFMGGGYSGCPIMRKQIQVNGQISYNIIGVHKGSLGTNAYGVMLNFQQNELFSFLNQYVENKIKGQLRLQHINNILKQLQTLQTKSPKQSEYVTDKSNIRWSKTVVKYHQIKYFISNPSTNLNSYQHYFIQLLNALNQLAQPDNLIFRKSTFKFLLQRFKHLKLNQQDQRSLFYIIWYLSYLGCYKQYSNQQLLQQILQISRKLFYFENQVFFKTKSYVIKNNVQYESNLNKDMIKLKKQTIQNFKANLPHKVKEQRKKYRNQRQMIFFNQFRQFQKAKQLAQANHDENIDQEADYTELFQKGNTMLNSNNFKQALVYFQRFYKISQTNKIQQNVILALQQIGYCHKCLKNLKKAQQSLKKCMDLLKRNRKERQKYASILNQIGVVYRQQSLYKLALECHQESIRILQANPNPGNNQHLSVAYSGIGNIKSELKNYKESILYFKQCYQIRKEMYGQNSIQLQPILNNIAVSYMQLKEYDKALLNHQKGLQILRRTFKGKQTEQAIDHYHNMANLYFEKSQYNQAVKYMKKAYEWKLRVYGSQHPSTKLSQQGYKLYLEKSTNKK